MADGRVRASTCPAGVRLVAFPAPLRSRSTVGVLRFRPAQPDRSGTVARTVRVSAALLRRAAQAGDAPTVREVRAAARTLRDPAGLATWQVQQRERGSGRQRTATAALAQFIAAATEFQELYHAAQRQGRALKKTQRLSDELAREAVSARELERARIAHQIHDTAAQSMVSAYRFLNAAASAQQDGVAEDVRVNQGMAMERLREAIGEVRSVLGQLVPAGLELGLRDAILYRHQALMAEGGLRGVVTGSAPRLREPVEQAVYGMVSEAMTNCTRHASATTLDVNMAVVRRRLVIVVRDDGIGFNPASSIVRRDSGGGLGLLGMTRQAHWFGGSAVIRSRPGRGTAIRISIPFERHRDPRVAEENPAVDVAD